MNIVNFLSRHNQGNKSLIYWDEKNQCDDFSRDRNDNIVTYFWPKLMSVKQSLSQIVNTKTDQTKYGTATFSKDNDIEMGTSILPSSNNLLEEELLYIKAKLCSGEDPDNLDENQKKILTDALQKQTSNFNENKVIVLNRICGELTNIVLSLHRVQEMKNRFSQICDTEDPDS